MVFDFAARLVMFAHWLNSIRQQQLCRTSDLLHLRPSRGDDDDDDGEADDDDDDGEVDDDDDEGDDLGMDGKGVGGDGHRTRIEKAREQMKM